MSAPGRNQQWSSLGKRLIVSSLALLIPAGFAVLCFAYSFSLGSTLQNFLVYSMIGLKVLLFVSGVILVVMAWAQKPSERQP
jgi:hypothetical protein